MSKAETARIVKIVQSYCQENGIRFTAPRQYVLEIIAGSKKPIGAYDVLEQLGKKIENPKPPTAYRAIEFLEEAGFIHRIESLNAYVMCHTDHKHEGSQFLICDECGTVAEAHLCALPKDLQVKANDAGFMLTRWNAEIHGLCSDCRKA